MSLFKENPDKEQCAKKSYFFDKGYKDLRNTIKDSLHNIWQKTDESGKPTYNRSSVMGSVLYLRDAWGSDSNILIKLFKSLFYVVLIIAMAIVGIAVTIGISAIHVILLLAVMAAIYAGFTIIWFIDRIYLWNKKVFAACPSCGCKSMIPVYICPNCGREHQKLIPGSYGILKRTCKCGYELPTTFLNGRSKLPARCPDCGHGDGVIAGTQVCIPVIGGPSVGKTAFITAFSHDFIEKTAQKYGWETEMSGISAANVYEDLQRHYLAGSTTKTARELDVTRAGSISLSFKLRGKGFKPERIVQVYDISGEVFSDNTSSEIQKQYEYCHGIALIIDPFSIPEVRYQHEDKLSDIDRNAIGSADMNTIIDTFLVKVKEVTGLSDEKMLKIPLAVVINKADEANLMDKLGPKAVQTLMKTDSKKFSNEMDCEDYLCRKFLQENGMESFLNLINIKFKSNRYFVCSSIGHTRDQGQYQPQGVMTVMEWVFRNADTSGFGSVWKETDFTKEPFALKKGLD